MPVIGNLVALPDDAGTLTLDFHAVPYAARTIRTRLKSPGKKAEYERIVAPIEFNLAARLAGTSATPAEIASMEQQAAAYVGNAHAWVRDFLEDTAWRPLLACNLLLDTHAGVLTLRFCFAAMAPLQLASATID